MAKRSPWFHDPELVRSRARSLGAAIQARRTELGLSRPELARRASLSYPYVAELETGRKQGSPSALHALASALDLSTHQLFARAEGGPGRSQAESLSELAHRVLDALEGRPPADAEAVLLMALGELRSRSLAPLAERDRPSGRKRETAMATHAEIVDFVEQNVTRPTTYGRVARAVGTSAQAVGNAMREAPDTFTKGHLVLRADWTISPEFRANGRGAEEAVRRLRSEDYTVEELPSGLFRLVDPE
jgi:transcriptional regulator with XRE-family HTH domain